MATVRKRGNTYQLRCSVGYDSNGRQIVKTKTWAPPTGWSEKRDSKEAHRQAALFEEAIRNGTILGGKTKFSEFSQLWFSDYAEVQLRPRTVARYKELMKRILPALGHLPLDAIRPEHLLAFYKKLAQCEPGNATYICIIDLKGQIKDSGMTKSAFAKAAKISESTLSAAFHRKKISCQSAQKISGFLGVGVSSLFKSSLPEATLSPATIRHYHRLVCDILNDAVHWQYIPYNPCLRINAPKADLPKISYLDDNQARRLLDLLRSEDGIYRRPISVLLLTGLRRGELLGLEWGDIDFTQHTIHVQRSSQYLPGKGVYTDGTKNVSSDRIVMVPGKVLDILREQHIWQELQKALPKTEWSQSDRIFTTANGLPIHPDRLTRWFSSFIKKTDLPQIHLHSLRHTYATLCIANGVPITAVAAQLGHANVATTAKIYAHAIKSAQIAAADKIENLLHI